MGIQYADPTLSSELSTEHENNIYKGDKLRQITPNSRIGGHFMVSNINVSTREITNLNVR